MLKYIGPDWISIGADSKKNNLPEPEASEIMMLVRWIENNTRIDIKPNLGRLTKV